jgi:hypothetical protein|nr:MAG TPA: resistance protein [Caudoviricetes sp.]
MKLFDIDERLAACVKLDESRVVDTESGEIIDLEAIAALEMERDKKLENLGCWYKNLLAEAEALKAQKNAFAEREKARRAKAESLKGFLGRYLNGKKFETAKVAMSFRKSEAVEFDAKCIGDVPEEFLKFKDPELDKVAVKKAIKAGETVPGCELVARQNLQIK